MAIDTITESDIWADLDKAFPTLTEREPGDIDAQQMMARYGIVESAARSRIAKLVRSGAWQYIDVKDDTCKNGRRKVLRKVRK